MKDRKEYMRNYQAAWIKRRRLTFLMGKTCAFCGSNKNLEIDHIDRKTKEQNISQIWSYTESVRSNELMKCQILCRDCHRNKTKNEYISLRRPLVHGTDHGYEVWNCRCVGCKKAHSIRTCERKLKRLAIQ